MLCYNSAIIKHHIFKILLTYSQYSLQLMGSLIKNIYMEKDSGAKTQSQDTSKSKIPLDPTQSEPDDYNNDIKEIEAAIIKERYSAQIFPYLKDPMERIMKLITNQEAGISTRDVKSEEVFYLNIYKMELERVKYIVKSYLRARLAKFHKYLLLIVNKDFGEYLSLEEFNYVSKLYKLKACYFNDEILKNIPDDYGYNMLKGDMKTDMIIHPSENEWVAAKAMKLITELSGVSIPTTIKVGEKIMIPFKNVKQDVLDGGMTLL